MYLSPTTKVAYFVTCFWDYYSWAVAAKNLFKSVSAIRTAVLAAIDMNSY
jgi:hypothetical protein